MRALRPSELAAIVPELSKQKIAQEFNEQRNPWSALAATITNGFMALAAAMSGRRRRPKWVKPDDFLGKEFKRLAERILAEGKDEAPDWGAHIEDAKSKGLKGPW